MRAGAAVAGALAAGTISAKATKTPGGLCNGVCVQEGKSTSTQHSPVGSCSFLLSSSAPLVACKMSSEISGGIVHEA